VGSRCEGGGRRKGENKGKRGKKTKNVKLERLKVGELEEKGQKWGEGGELT